MDVSSNLLVAMMFIMILSIGIGNVLMALPAIVDHRRDLAVGRLHLSWIFLLLLLHLAFFWQVLLILEDADWNFAGFLYIITGPILLLLATSIMLPDPAPADDLNAQYLSNAPPVFTLLALLMLWLPGVDLIFGSGLNVVSFVDLAVGGVFALLALSDHWRVHVLGAWLAWAALVGLLAARGLGLTS